ncbi:MAG: type II secretion system F family protein [Nitrospinae bacterium]|nr:type II secretion system F family protein [Nitrospinota bacterium]
MAIYQYKARNRMGALVEGNMDAPSADVVGQELGRMGHFPVSIKSLSAASDKEEKDVLDRFRKVKPQEIVLFTRQMATLFNAGIPLLAILSALGENMQNPKFKDIIRHVRLDIEGGLTLSGAMGKYPDVFSSLYTSMIEAGEAGGVMDQILRRLADLLEKDAENEAKIKGAMRYPKIVVTAMTLAVTILMWKVVPVFVGIFEKAKITLPTPTKLLIGAHHIFTDYWYYMALAIGAAIFAFKKYTATERGRRRWDRFKLKAPLFGPIVLRSSMAKFARIFGTLQMGGVPILETLDITSRVVENVIIAQIIRDLRAAVQDGLGLAAPLKLSGMVPPMVIQMIAAGEESGALDEMLLKVADFYDEEVDRAIKSLSAMIEPILLVFMAALVLFLALSIFLPMWDMSKMAKGGG